MRTDQPSRSAPSGKCRAPAARRFLLAASACLLTGCAGLLPSGGPSSYSVRHPHKEEEGIQIVKLTEPVVRSLADESDAQSFAERFPSRPRRTNSVVGPGDVIDVTITEAPPASLFGTVPSEAGRVASGATSASPTVHATTFPEQMISAGGTISIPFAGQIQAAGKTMPQIEDEIAARLKEKANQPQVLVRLVSNNSSYVTVLGAVTAGARVPLSPHRDRLLDALAKAGATFDDVNKVSIQLTRGPTSATMSLGAVTRYASQNIPLEAGDVITILKHPSSCTVLGAIARNQELDFEGTSITLAQALARSGGLNDASSNIRGVFVFRFESRHALDWPKQPVRVNAAGKVPVVYNLDLADPAGFFVAKTFQVRDGDILYTADSPFTELEKFLGILGTLTSPVANASATTAAARVP